MIGFGIINNQSWSLNDESDSWETLTVTLPTANCKWYGACNTDQGIIISGGCAGTAAAPKKECWLLEKTSHIWKRFPSMKCTRAWHTMLFHEGTVFAVGGSDGSESLSSVEMFTPGNDSWLSTSSMLKPLCQPLVVSAERRVFVLAGYYSDNENLDLTWSHSVQAFDPSRSSWQWMAESPEMSCESAAVSFEGNIYVVGGKSRSCMIYHPLTDTWKKLTRPT